MDYKELKQTSIANKDIENKDLQKKSISIRSYKCEECDSAFCELFLWCKGGNIQGLYE